jgi:CheY-like chemotaxis protein
MGGDVTVDSEEGKGATDTVMLPTVSQTEVGSAHQEGTTVVALMHDERAAVRIAEDLSGALRVIGATEPSQFATLARRENPDLLAVDARAADHGAWRAVGALQSESATADIPLVLFAHQDELAETAIDLGYLTVLSKPISVERATGMVIAAAGTLDGTEVLIADDDPDVRRILGETLSAAGCEVYMAASGGEALEVARRRRPGVALVDLLMPGMDGVEVIAVMRSEPTLQDVQVIAILSREMAEDEMERLAASIASLGRTHRARTLATADILRAAAGSQGSGQARPGAVA